MPTLDKDSDAPGPLVKSSDLVPSVVLGKNTKVDSSATNPEAPILMVLAGGLLVGATTISMMLDKLWLVGCLAGISVVGTIAYQVPSSLRMSRMLKNTTNLALRADTGDLRATIAELENQLAIAKSGGAQIVALFDLGYYELRAGNHERALACLSECYRWLVQTNPNDILLLDNIRYTFATIYAIKGDLSAACAWLPTTNTVVESGRIVTLARSGEFEAVLERERYRSNPEYEVMLAHSMRVFALMKSFAQWSLDKSKMDEDDLEAAHPVFATEYDYLCTYWSELAEFVSTLEVKERLAVGGIPAARVISDKSTTHHQSEEEPK